MKDKTTTEAKNRKVALYATLGVFGMVGLSFASVPLYDLFCRVTGYGGTTQQSDEVADVILDRDVTVRFDASVNSELLWEFKPVQIKTDMKVGQSAMAFYRAKNTSDEPITGTATFNVTPLKVGQYFVKVDCFCFTEQLLNPGQEVDMPVSFYVDPAIADDPNLDDVKTITLSYTFFRADEEDEEDDESGVGELAMVE